MSESPRGYAHVHHCFTCDERYLCAGDVCEVEDIWFGKDRQCNKCFSKEGWDNVRRRIFVTEK